MESCLGHAKNDYVSMEKQHKKLPEKETLMISIGRESKLIISFGGQKRENLGTFPDVFCLYVPIETSSFCFVRSGLPYKAELFNKESKLLEVCQSEHPGAGVLTVHSENVYPCYDGTVKPLPSGAQKGQIFGTDAMVNCNFCPLPTLL